MTPFSRFDRVVLWLVRRRLARCVRLGDAADLLADALMGLLTAEVVRRRAEVRDWHRQQEIQASTREFSEFEPQEGRLQ